MIIWHGDKFLKEMHDGQVENLTRACVFLQNEVKKQLGNKAPPPSNPGESPHLESGQLRQSITYEVDDAALKGRIGTNKEYGKYLEEGTGKMEARPFLEKTLEANSGVVAGILAKKVI